MRDDVNKALELARSEKVVGKPLDAKITLYVSPEAEESFKQIEDQDFNTMFITSEVHVIYGEGAGTAAEKMPGIAIKVEASEAPKCVRCWTHSYEVGQNAEHPELCARCAGAVTE